jgi:PHD/YefM family antitoxin component YafN of YafNO toxin-antitoxin module
MRNNTLAAVIVSPEEYDLLKIAGELVEHLEIAEMIGLRLKGHKRARNIPWEKEEIYKLIVKRLEKLG